MSELVMVCPNCKKSKGFTQIFRMSHLWEVQLQLKVDEDEHEILPDETTMQEQSYEDSRDVYDGVTCNSCKEEVEICDIGIVVKESNRVNPGQSDAFFIVAKNGE